MTERVTRSKTGKTPSKPVHPGFVETPGRKKYTRKSIIPDVSSDDVTEGDRDASTTTATDLTSSIDSLAANGNGNGKLNGHANGHTNGHLNGTANGTANGIANGVANGVANGHSRKESKGANDYENFGPYDTSGEREFGGSFGMVAMMTGFPALMYYMWIGAFFYDGKFPKPAPGQGYGAFFETMWNLVKTEAYPTARAWKIYWVFGIVQLGFYMLLPGIWRKGKALPHLGGKQLDYYCSAMWSFYTSIALALLLDFTGTFKIFTLIEEFGHVMSVAIISGFACSLIAYVSAIARSATIRMTGWPIYDFFLGAELNPRLFGMVDIKMFLEVRIPWFMMFFMTLGTCIKQYEVYGYVSAPALFMLLAHWLYANSCAKGEHLIITTWDMYYEKLGFMLIFWNMAGVPLSYCHCTLFIARHDPTTYAWPTWVYVLMAVSYLGVYYVWDTTNSQKNQFRQEERGIVDERTTFPYFRYGRIANPKTIPTKQGNKILCDGWYGKARKIHYPCDAFFAICWGLVTGFNSAFPWFYSVFFCLMIIHRARRDIEKCRKVYGEAWTEYEKRVPYLFIPYVY